MGRARMMKIDWKKHGDCLELIKQIDDKSIDIAFTSPPYNRKRNDKYSHYDDIISDYYGFLKNIIDEMRRVFKGHVIVNLQTNYYNKADVYKIIGHYAKEIQQLIVWEKSNPLPANGFNVTNAYELFLVIGDKALKANQTYTKNIITTSVNSNMPKNHHAVMKMEVAEWFIKSFTREGDIIIDPFMGIGTTAIVCRENNRHFVGFELSKEYYDMAIENMKGQKNE